MAHKPDIDTHKTFGNFKTRKSTDFIVVHCAASQNKPEFDWKTIDRVHRSNGWLCIGYHFVIRTDGTIQNGRPMDAVGSHAKDYNNNSIGICLIGGIDSSGKPCNNFTAHQMAALKELIDWLHEDVYPKATILGHCDLPNVNKACPCFDVAQWYKGFINMEDVPVDVYRVSFGDTLSGISRKTGVSVDELARINRIYNINIIHEGQILKLGG